MANQYVNTMKIKNLVAILLACICVNSYAQLKGFSIGPYAEYAWPTDHLKETNKNGIGAGINADVRLGKLGLTGSAGFIYFGGNTITTTNGPETMPSVNAIPIRAGLKYRIIPLLYIKLEGGIAKFTNGDSSAYILSPGIGLRILGLDVLAKYESWILDGTHSFWGLKVGYNF
jgi:hypothetical protein